MRHYIGLTQDFLGPNNLPESEIVEALNKMEVTDFRRLLELISTLRTGHYSGRDPNSLLTGEEAAEFLGVSPKTLANARVAGSSPPYVKAFGIRYRYQDLLEFVASKVRSSTSISSDGGSES